jgi:hypothetical protein
MPFPQQVDSKSIMQASFMTGVDRNIFGGVLLYHLQKKDNDKSDKDTSISTQLLVIWGYRCSELYSHALLIEHESVLVWKKDKLKRLYDEYNSKYDTGFIIVNWLLNDNTKLEIGVIPMRNGFEMELFISEECLSPGPIKPLLIDSNR